MIHRATIRKIASLILTLVALLGSTISVCAATSKDLYEQANQVGQQISETQKELEEAQGQADALQEEANHLSTKVTKLSNQLNSVLNDIKGTEASIDELTTKIEQTKAQLDEATAIADEQYEMMKLRIQFMYENSHISMLSQVLESKSISELLKKVEYINQITHYDRNMYADYCKTQAQIAEAKAELEIEQETLSDYQEQLSGKRSELDSLVVGAKSDLNDKNEEVADANASIDNLEEQIKQMKIKEAQLEEAAAEAAIEEARRIAEAQAAAGLNEIFGGTPYSASEADFAVLSAIIYCEAGGETYDAQLAVGSVVMNRVQSSSYPNSITEVVMQNNGKVWQFSPVQSGRFQTVLSNGSASAKSKQAAQEVLDGYRNTQFFNFMTVSLAQKKGLDTREDIAYTIMDHCFFWGYKK